MRAVRIAVIGCGYMGGLHAQKLAQMPEANLVAVVDPLPEARLQVARRCGAAPLADFRLLFLEPLDAAVIAVPTALHARVAMEFIVRGIHVFVEKPLAATAEDAGKLVDRAERAGVILQVGHIERFNPAFEIASAHCRSPLFIHSIRCGKLVPRTMASDVIVDLLIHDLDLVLRLAKSPPTGIEAVGWSLLGSTVDFVYTRLRFASGLVCACTASRVSRQLVRRMEIFEKDAVIDVDFATRRVSLAERAPEGGTFSPHGLLNAAIADLAPSTDLLDKLFPAKVHEFPEADPLKAELVDFLCSIREGRPPRVDGRQALEALLVAERVREQMALAPVAPDRALSGESARPSTAWLTGPHWSSLPRPEPKELSPVDTRTSEMRKAG